MTLEVAPQEGYSWTTADSGGCGPLTAQGLETSLLSAVSVVPTAIKHVNEKGKLAYTLAAIVHTFPWSLCFWWMVLLDEFVSCPWHLCSSKILCFQCFPLNCLKSALDGPLVHPITCHLTLTMLIGDNPLFPFTNRHICNPRSLVSSMGLCRRYVSICNFGTAYLTFKTLRSWFTDDLQIKPPKSYQMIFWFYIMFLRRHQSNSAAKPANRKWGHVSAILSFVGPVWTLDAFREDVQHIMCHLTTWGRCNKE